MKFGPQAWPWYVNLLLKHTILVITMMFLATMAGALWHLSRISIEFIEVAALEGMAVYAESLEEVRKVYASEVVDRLGDRVKVTHDYATKEGAIPLPITFSMDVGRRVSRDTTGIQLRIFSDFPFPWRTDGGARDNFEKEAIHRLRQFPDKPFYRFEEFQGRQSLRYAVADRMMEAACVSCHNKHPDSPKTNWKIGEVRGVIEIIRPLDSVIAQVSARLRDTFAVMAMIGVVGLSSLALVIAKLRRVSTEAEQRAKALEGEIAVRRNVEQELRRAKEAAVAANAAKNHFLGKMSHELRTPLNAILGYTELIRDNIYGEVPDKMRQILERLEANGRELRSLINRVFDIAKMEEGRPTLSISDYSMTNIAHTVFNALEPVAKEKHLELKIALAADLPRGRGDEQRLTQVLMNLVANAIKFTEVGEVKLAVKVSDGAFLVSIADTGSGIAPADQQRIFEDFGRIDQSTSRGGGVGLGLSVAKRIVELHGGRLWVKSTLGEGSTFYFTIPVRVVQRGMT